MANYRHGRAAIPDGLDGNASEAETGHLQTGLAERRALQGQTSLTISEAGK
jgi:hypothetical protein